MSYGVGIRFDGYPNDVIKFKWILAKESCHPKAADRILNRITKNGYDLMTIMNGVKFDWVKSELEKVGVMMSFIPPMENWENKYNDEEW